MAPTFSEPTLDLQPDRSEPLSSTAERSPGGPCIALVDGSRPPEWTCELETLLRRRLRLAAGIMLLGFSAFLAWCLLVVGLSPLLSDWLSAAHGALVAVLAAVTLWLGGRKAIPLRQLRMAELMIFGLPAAFFAAAHAVATVQYAARGDFQFETGTWLVLMYTYSLFIPNTFRRAAVVIACLALLPIVLLGVLIWWSPEVARLASLEQRTWIALLMVVAGVGAALGVDTIGTLRRRAFEAQQLGQYRLKRRLGAGGMGEVYLAEHQLLKRPCVVKLIRPEKAGDRRALARFQREVRATARLSHWNTVEVYDYGNTADGTFYYVMEYLPGVTLGELVARHGPLPPERAIYFLRQACDALREAHAIGLVHRDLKPGNLFVAQRGGVFDVVKILDFGLVKPLAEDQPVHLTLEGSIAGSPQFMSPEQATGEGQPDVRSDIYSLGAVGYFMLTGRPPFEADRPIPLLIAHAREQVVPPSRHRPEIPADLEQIVLRCLAKSPEDRYPSVVALDEALSQCEAAGLWNRQRAAEWWQQQGLELAVP
ncbi:MAG: serine/threonine-protein kinase [Thermoguttaceae bacterium]